jgi:hypothetical protein
MSSRGEMYAAKAADAIIGSCTLHVGLPRQEYRHTLLIFNISCFFTRQ